MTYPEPLSSVGEGGNRGLSLRYVQGKGEHPLIPANPQRESPVGPVLALGPEAPGPVGAGHLAASGPGWGAAQTPTPLPAFTCRAASGRRSGARGRPGWRRLGAGASSGSAPPELRVALPAAPSPGRVGGRREGRGGAGPPPCSFHSHSQGCAPRPQRSGLAASEPREPLP